METQNVTNPNPQPQAGGQPQTLIVKRYKNRKLYDTESSKYITLTEIALAVRSGASIVVKDNISGEDITKRVLGQVVANEGLLSTQDLLNILTKKG